MRALLLGLAASAAAMALPGAAAAEGSDRLEFVGVSSTNSGIVSGHHDGRFRRHRGHDGTVVVYDRDYQGDSSWRSDSFNDWWHDKPERSYPRWMVSNQNCDRMWWGGGAWRC